MTIALPPMPEPWQYMAFQIGDSNADGFTADQMRAYAIEAQQLAIEAAAKLCEDRAGTMSMFATVREARANDQTVRGIAAAIRAMMP